MFSSGSPIPLFYKKSENIRFRIGSVIRKRKPIKLSPFQHDKSLPILNIGFLPAILRSIRFKSLIATIFKVVAYARDITRPALVAVPQPSRLLFTMHPEYVSPTCLFASKASSLPKSRYGPLQPITRLRLTLLTGLRPGVHYYRASPVIE